MSLLLVACRVLSLARTSQSQCAPLPAPEIETQLHSTPYLGNTLGQRLVTLLRCSFRQATLSRGQAPFGNDAIHEPFPRADASQSPYVTRRRGRGMSHLSNTTPGERSSNLVAMASNLIGMASTD